MVISRQIRFLQLLWLIYLRNKVKKLDFQDRLGILLEMRLSGVAEQNYTVSYGKYQIKEQQNGKEYQTSNEE